MPIAPFPIVSFTITGTIDGTNPTFNLNSVPHFLMLNRSGYLLDPGVDYTIVGSTITFLNAAIPQVGDILLAEGQ